MNKVAFVTYNTVGDNLANGWHGSNGRRALVLQNTKGLRWFAKQSNTNSAEASRESGRVRDEIDRLWSELQESLAEIDHVVVYVGASGSERAIELVSQLPAEKVTFVGCSCGVGRKTALIEAAGMTSSRKLLCECGGCQTMGMLFEVFMADGMLLSARAN